MSALFLAAALPEDGRVVTVEASEPQRTVSQQLLAQHEPTRVTALRRSPPRRSGRPRAAGRRRPAVPRRRPLPGGLRRGRRGVRAAARPGALLLLDDIRWPGDPGTYDGWREVAALPQVRAAAEVDGAYGLLLL
jgi:predicted O-methyltransferase YrrM